MKKVLGAIIAIITITSLICSNQYVEARKSFEYKWPNSPRTVYFRTDISGTQRSAIQSAMSTWNSVKDFNNRSMITLSFTTDEWECNTISYISGVEYIGYANIGSQGSDILSVDIMLNEDKNLVVGAKPGSYDIQSVALHELGHGLGIAHCHEQGESSCFSSTCSKNTLNPYSIANSISRRTLQDYDKASYKSIYAMG